MENLELDKIFRPNYYRRRQRVIDNNLYFAHYTSSDAAISILQNKKIWLRNATLMNDYSEILYGYKLFRDFIWNETISEIGRIEDAFKQAYRQLEREFENWHNNTYILCLSEHDLEKDKIGKLSMWRGYGSGGGVALILKKETVVMDLSPFNIETTPVEYLDYEGFKGKLREVIRNVEAHEGELGNVDIASEILYSMRYAVLSVKHPIFAEEREWRVFGTAENLDLGKPAIRAVRGTMQPIYEIPLTDKPTTDKENGYSINESLQEIIVGPTPQPTVTRTALETLLSDCGVQNATQKIRYTELPYRG